MTPNILIWAINIAEAAVILIAGGAYGAAWLNLRKRGKTADDALTLNLRGPCRVALAIAAVILFIVIPALLVTYGILYKR